MAYAFLLLAFTATDTFTGKVVAVTDGDTIVVLHNERQVKIRLRGIDCPELGQAYGRQAKKRASDLVFGKTVTVRSTGKDRYDRTLADVILPDGRILDQEMVRSGHAWWFRRYSDDKKLKQLEADAKSKKLGLWSATNPTPPWDWRAARRKKSNVAPSKVKIVPNGVAVVALLPNPKGQDVGREQVTIANSNGEAVTLDGWKLIDKAGNVFTIKGNVAPGGKLVITMTAATMPLNNDGDMVVLIDGEGVARSRVEYAFSQARSGAVIRFGR